MLPALSTLGPSQHAGAIARGEVISSNDVTCSDTCLFRHVSGKWIARTEPRTDNERYGSLAVLAENAEAAVRDIITGGQAPAENSVSEVTIAMRGQTLFPPEGLSRHAWTCKSGGEIHRCRPNSATCPESDSPETPASGDGRHSLGRAPSPA